MQLLNDQQRISRYSSKNVDINTLMLEHIAHIYQLYYQPATQQFNYLRFGQSEDFQTYQLMLNGLHHFDTGRLKTDSEKISFWLNIYNMLCIHLVVKLDVTKGIEKHSGFFSQYGYLINGQEYSLDDIEHGILRANRKAYSKLHKPFKDNDFRLVLACKEVEQRIHFGLYSASISSPRLVLFDAKNIEQQLQQNTAHYINKHLQFNINQGVLDVPKIFKWYESDFGSKDKIVEFIAEHTENELTQSTLLAHKKNIKLELLAFNWALNNT